eukprot:m.21790 g.21790  ORF g.21790 m.21790 type:complete len:105 (+) comp12528_c0_seq1:69-383(+)
MTPQKGACHGFPTKDSRASAWMVMVHNQVSHGRNVGSVSRIPTYMYHWDLKLTLKTQSREKEQKTLALNCSEIALNGVVNVPTKHENGSARMKRTLYHIKLAKE